MKHGTPLAALLAVALLGASPRVRAQDAPTPGPVKPAPARLFLDYERAPGAGGCLAPHELASAVEQRLGRRVFVPASDAEIHAQVRAGRAGRGFAIDVELRGPGERSLGRRRLNTRARHCSALDDSLTLVVSLAADLSLAPAREAPVSVTPLESAIEVPASSFAPRLGWHARPSVGVTALSGLLPALGTGLAVELELRPPRFWPLWLRATRWHGQRVVAGTTGAEFSAQSLELGMCPWTLELGNLELRSCVEQLFGRVHARGFGFDLDQSGASVTLAWGAMEALSFRYGDWFISVSGSLLAPLVQRRYFYLDGNEITLHDQAWVWGLGGLSLGLEL
ncbi:MAG: hypothetical protein ABI895_33805 [Deltaproteobacteria bacterium]